MEHRSEDGPNAGMSLRSSRHHRYLGSEVLPTVSGQAHSATSRILPMDLKVGDRLVDETGEWEVVGRPYTTAGGKTAHARVQRVGRPLSDNVRT